MGKEEASVNEDRKDEYELFERKIAEFSQKIEYPPQWCDSSLFPSSGGNFDVDLSTSILSPSAKRFCNRLDGSTSTRRKTRTEKNAELSVAELVAMQILSEKSGRAETEWTPFEFWDWIFSFPRTLDDSMTTLSRTIYTVTGPLNASSSTFRKSERTKNFVAAAESRPFERPRVFYYDAKTFANLSLEEKVLRYGSSTERPKIQPTASGSSIGECANFGANRRWSMARPKNFAAGDFSSFHHEKPVYRQEIIHPMDQALDLSGSSIGERANFVANRRRSKESPKNFAVADFSSFNHDKPVYRQGIIQPMKQELDRSGSSIEERTNVGINRRQQMGRPKNYAVADFSPFNQEKAVYWRKTIKPMEKAFGVGERANFAPNRGQSKESPKNFSAAYLSSFSQEKSVNGQEIIQPMGQAFGANRRQSTERSKNFAGSELSAFVYQKDESFGELGTSSTCLTDEGDAQSPANRLRFGKVAFGGTLTMMGHHVEDTQQDVDEDREVDELVGVVGALRRGSIESVASSKSLAPWIQLGYTLRQVNGERRFGPRPGAAQPPRGCEVYLSNLPRDCFEDELVPLVQTFGRVYCLRLKVEFSGMTRGYAFVQYETECEAKSAMRQLDVAFIRPGIRLVAKMSVDNRQLFMSGVDFGSCDEVHGALYAAGVQGLLSVLRTPPANHRVLLTFSDHWAASQARKRLLAVIPQLWGPGVEMDWSEPREDLLGPSANF